MSSAQYSFPKASAGAPETQKRASSNSYSGGDWFNSDPLPSKRAPQPPQRLPRSKQPPSPPPSASNASNPVPNGTSAFQPRSRGERNHPPQNRKSTNAAQQEPSSSSRTRRLPGPPIYMDNDALKNFQNKTAQTIYFSEPATVPIQFKNSVTRPRPPPLPRPKPTTHVVNLDDDSTPTSAIPPLEKRSEITRNSSPSPRLCHPYPNDFPSPPVPRKERNPHRNSLSDSSAPLHHVVKPAKPPVALRSVPRACASEQPKRNDAEPICVEDHPQPVLPPKPQPNSLTPRQTVVLTSRSPSPNPRPNATAKRQHPHESPMFTRKRPRHTSSNPTQRRSLRLQDKQKPDSTHENAMRPFAQGFNTAHGYSPNTIELPRSVATKPPRIVSTSDSEDIVTVVESKNTKRIKRRVLVPYEDTPYDHQHTLYHLQSENTRYIKLSFLGMSDGDLRKLFDCSIGIPDISSGGRHIQLNNNRLRRITSHIFQRFKDMKVISLILSSNLLTQIDQSLVLCTELKTLDLSRNSLRSLPEQIGDLSNLLCLNVSDNELTKLPALYLLRRLKILNVARNNLESFPEDVTEAGNALTALDVSGNQSFQCFPACCKKWDRLEDLILTGTEVFVYLTKKERKLRARVLIEELAGKSLEQLKNRTRRRRSSVRQRDISDAATTTLR